MWNKFRNAQRETKYLTNRTNTDFSSILHENRINMNISMTITLLEVLTVQIYKTVRAEDRI